MGAILVLEYLLSIGAVVVAYSMPDPVLIVCATIIVGAMVVQIGSRNAP